MKLKIILSLLLVMFLIGCSNGNGGTTSSSTLEMQGFELNVPRGYECTGGFTQGYRYLDANCEPSTGNYEINVDYGLPVTSINPDQSFTEYFTILRAREYNDNCIAYQEPVVAGSDTYLCIHTQNAQRTITMGMGKIYNQDFARWFEAHLVILDEDLDEEEMVETLSSFLRQSIEIDWKSFDS